MQIINQLLQKFEQSKQFVRMFKNNGKFPSFLGNTKSSAQLFVEFRKECMHGC